MKKARPEDWRLRFGANLVAPDRASFRVWAPLVSKMELKLEPGRRLPMRKDADGVFSAEADGVRAGQRYRYVLEGGRERADPVSRYLPEGPFGPTQVVDPSAFRWHDGSWKGIALKDYIFYELHVGSFTSAGTFDAAIARLGHVRSLGATCVEVMPVSQFSGNRGWGYDGVSLYAVQNSYGGPDGLKRLVDACHAAGLAVCLDVVYNHFGPEGNFIHEFAPYYSRTYCTPWGSALNFDAAHSDFVRDFIVQNAVYWVSEYHADALRLDATEWLFDIGPRHILSEIPRAVKREAERLGRQAIVVAESDQNNPIVVRPPQEGGYGFDAQWSDDFHHSVHAVLTGERYGYYEDFSGLEDVAHALRRTFVYEGQYSRYRLKRHGADASAVPGERFVINLQNHDQVGNRPLGDRLTAGAPFPQLKAAAVLLLTAPNLPLLFMGQEYGEERPFPYFVDFSDPGLVRAVRKGRSELPFARPIAPNLVPDPKSEATFLGSKLDWNAAAAGRHEAVFNLYRDLIALRRAELDLERAGKNALQVDCSPAERWIALLYPGKGRENLGIVVSFAEKPTAARPFGDRAFREILNTEDARYGGQQAGRRVRRNPIRGLSAGGIIGRVEAQP